MPQAGRSASDATRNQRAPHARAARAPTRRLLAAGLVATTLATTTTTRAAVEERAWCVVSNPHFEIVTDLRERKALALAASLDRFRIAASALLPGDVDARWAASPTPALRLLVFKRARDFAGLFGFPRIAGFAQPSLRQSLLVFGPSPSGKLDTIAFHEYTHHLLRSRVTLNLPIWYEEGFASYLATLDVDKNDVVTVGRGPYPLLLHLLKKPKVRVEAVMEEHFRVDWQRHDLNDIYILAWGIVRFLLHAKQPTGERHAAAVGAFLDAIDRGTPSPSALREQIGIAPQNLHELMRRHYERFHNTQPPVFKFRLPSYQPPPFQYECLDEANKLLALADAVSRHRPERAKTLYEQLLEQLPGHTAALVGLSRVQTYERKALAIAERAAAAAPANATALVRLAETLMASCPRLTDDGCARTWTQAARAYARALSLDPLRADAALGLGVFHLHTSQPRDALPHLRAALARAPWSPRIHFYLGHAHRRAGAVREARLHFRKTAHWHPDPRWRERAFKELDQLAEADAS